MSRGQGLRAALLCLAALLAACNRQSPPAATGSEPTPAASTAGANSPALASAKAKPAQATAPEASTITRINEDGSESVEDTSSDSSTHNPILAAVAAAISTPAAAATSLSAPTPWQEGVNYTRLVPAQPTSVAPGQVEVVEFFWYACPHCNAIDPLVEAWRKTKAPYISFRREHVMWSPSHRSLARMFYTLQSMGKLDEVHALIFKEIHVGNNPLVDPGNDPAKSEEIQATFLAKHDVSAAAFKAAYESFPVETALQRSDELWGRYRISGVPTFVINGKFITDVGMARGEEQLFSLISDLAALEHKR